MWGNISGWAISVVIVGLTSLILFAYGTAPNVSDSSGKFTPLVKSATLTVDPATIDLKPGTDDTDAAKLYGQVIENYIANKAEYADKNHNDSVWLHDHPPKIIDLIVKAADCAKSTTLVGKPESVINYGYPLDPIDALHTAGTDACAIAAVDLSKKDFSKAIPLLRATFVLGQRMYNERLRWEEFTDGTDLMKQAATGEAMIAAAKKDDDADKKCTDLVQAIDKFTQQVTPLWTAVCSVGNPNGDPLDYPGDMFEIAQNKNNDPMWRIEALLKLGRMRFMGNVGAIDQRGAGHFATKLAESADPDITPGIRLAAQKARDLDRMGFLKFGA